MIGPQAQSSTETDVREVQASMVGKAGITEKKKKTETARRRSRRCFRTRRSKREKGSRKRLRGKGTGVEWKLAEVNIVGNGEEDLEGEDDEGAGSSSDRALSSVSWKKRSRTEPR